MPETITITERLFCACGKPLSVSEHTNGLFILKCGIGGCMSYGIQDSSPMFKIDYQEQIKFTWPEPAKPIPNIPGTTTRIIQCKAAACKTIITEEQAKRTFKEWGKAMCAAHEGVA